MGYAVDLVTGKPIYDNVSNTQADLQAAADFAEKALGDDVATIGDLPDDGGRVGRHLYVDAEKCDYVWNGVGWDRQVQQLSDFAPSIISGLSVGAGGSLLYAKAGVIGAMAFVRIGWQLGSSGFTVNDPVIVPPIPFGAGVIDTATIGTVGMNHVPNGALGRFAGVAVMSGTNIRIKSIGTNGLQGTVTSSSPFPWGSTDQILLEVSYPA